MNEMKSKFIKCAAAAVLSIGAAVPALGGSVTRPGDTIGLAVGLPLPEGVYLGNNTTQECRNTNPKTTCYLVDTPIIVWSTPWTIFGARLEPSFGPLVPIKFNSGANGISGLFNSFAAAQLIWDLGNNWGFNYMLGGYTKGNSSVTFSSGSLNQRFGLSYTGDGWNLTANAIWGIQFDHVTGKPQISPCPVSSAYPHNGCNPDFLNVDLTATKRFGQWEVGPVGTYSTDLNAPIAAYKTQSQFALGGLVGYYFDKVSVQAYVTSNVYQKNYGGSNISGNFRITIPLWNPPPPAVAAAQ
ncbi:MAG: transporter [Steroidobacteraceae bacterium]